MIRKDSFMAFLPIILISGEIIPLQIINLGRYSGQPLLHDQARGDEKDKIRSECNSMINAESS
jgi:hypothetical protein